jgi:hypothetical protein
MYKMQAASVTFTKFKMQSLTKMPTISGGNIDMQGLTGVRVVSEFNDIKL